MENTTFDSSPSKSYIFGWTTPFWRWKLIFFGLLNGVLCQAGFNFAVSIYFYIIFLFFFVNKNNIDKIDAIY